MLIQRLESLLVTPIELFKEEIEVINDNGLVEIQPIHCESFKEIVDYLKTRLSITRSIEDTLATIMSVVISTPLPGNSLWVHIIGPPSSGKTTIIELFDAARKYVVPRSTFTGLVSGFKKPKNTDNDDSVSPIEIYNGKTIMVKDLTPLLTQSEAQKQKVFGQLRDAYDRSIRVDYLNDEKSHYENVQFSMVTGVTDVVRTMDDSLLGARFLCCEYMDAEYEAHINEHLDRAINNAIEDATTLFSDNSKDNGGASSTNSNSSSNNAVRDDKGHIDISFGIDQLFIGENKESDYPEIIDETKPESELDKFNNQIRGMVYGFIKHKSENWNNAVIPIFDDKTKKRIGNLASLCVLLRTKVERDKKGRTLQKIRPEMPMRFATQLSKLHVMLTYVLSLPVNSMKVHEIVTKISIDTINPHGHRWQVLKNLIPRSDDLTVGITAIELQKRSQVNLESVAHVLLDFDELGIIEVIKPERSRNAMDWLYKPNVKVLNGWKLIFGE